MMRRSLAARWETFWLGPMDPIVLETFRVSVGCALLLYLAAWWRDAPEWLTTAGFHGSAKAITFAPVAPPLPPAALPWFGLLLFGGVAAFTLGWKTRWATWVSWACVVYVTVADHLAAYSLNRFFILKLLILGLTIQGCYWSLDRHPPRPQSVWPLRILQATVLAHYCLAGWSKISHGDWLQNPGVLWTQVNGIYRTDAAAWMLRTLPLGVWSWMQYTALTFELTAPLLFTIRRLRPLGILLGVGFQLLVALTMYQLIYFSLQMLCFYVLFIDPKSLHRLRRRLRAFGRAIQVA